MEDFARHKHHNALTTTKRLFLPLSVLFFVSLVVLFIAANMLIDHEERQSVHFISPLAAPLQETYTSFKQSFFSSSLEKRITAKLEGEKGTYAFVIKNLKTCETYVKNEQRQFAAASLYKLWLVGTAFQQIEEGKIQESSVLRQNATTLNTMFDIASDSAERQEGTVTMTIIEAITRSITISNNTAALLLTSEVRVSNMKNFLRQYNMEKTNTKSVPETTAADIALFYEKLYKKELVSRRASEDILTILSQQQITDRIPKYLPPSIKIAHKTGELYKFKHDAGIVYTAKGDYIIVALSETNDPKAAAETIAAISQEVYTYFNQKE